MIICHKCGWMTGEKGKYDNRDVQDAIKHEFQHLGVGKPGDEIEIKLVMERMTKEYACDAKEYTRN